MAVEANATVKANKINEAKAMTDVATNKAMRLTKLMPPRSTRLMWPLSLTRLMRHLMPRLMKPMS